MNKLNEELNRMKFLAGIDKNEKNTLEEGLLQNLAVGLGLTLSSLTNVLAQNKDIEKLKYSEERKEELLNSLKDPNVQTQLKKLGVPDNNIKKQIEILDGKEIEKYQEKTIYSDKQLYSLVKSGWHLTSSQSDTVLQSLKQQAPEAEIDTIVVPMNEETMFVSGAFQLDETDKLNIKNLLDSIENSQSVLLEVNIISSTDKQRLTPNLQNTLKTLGYEPNNKGLSQARNNGVMSVITGFGVDSSLISQEMLAEQGENEIDQSVRYVVALFSVTKTIPELPAEKHKKEIKIISTYTLFRPLFKAPTKKLGRRNISVCPTKVKTHHKKVSPIECFFEQK